MISLQTFRNSLVSLLIMLLLITSLIIPSPVYSADPEDSQIFISGFNSYQQKDYAGTIEKMNEVLTKYPDTPLRDMALFWLSRAYYKNGNQQDAAKYLSQFSKEYPDNPLKSTVEDELQQLAERYDKGEKLAAGPAPTKTVKTVVKQPTAAEKAKLRKAEEERLAAEKKAASEKLAAEKAEAERVAAAKAKEEKLAADKLAADKIAAEKLVAEKAEADRLAKLKAEEEQKVAAKAGAESLASAKAGAEKLATDKLTAEKAEADRLTKLKAEEEQKVAAKAEAERVAAAKAEVERIASAKAEADKLVAEKAAAEKVAAEKIVAEQAELVRLSQLKAEEAKVASEKEALDRIAEEKAAAAKFEAERLASTKSESEKLAAEKAAAEKVAADKIAEEKLAAEKAAADKLAAEKAETLRLARLKAEEEQKVAAKAEAERVAQAKVEAERLALARSEADKLTAEKAAAEKLAADKVVAEQAELVRLALVKAEQAKAASENEAVEDAIAKLAAEKAATEQDEQQKLAADKKAEEDRVLQLVEAEKVAKQKAESEKVVAEKAAADKAEADRIAALKASEEQKEASKAEVARLAAANAEAERLAAVKAEEKRLAEAQASAEKAASAKKAFREKAIAQYKSIIETYPNSKAALSAAAKLKELGIAVAVPVQVAAPAEQPENSQTLRFEVAQYAGFEFNLLATPQAYNVGQLFAIPFELINRGNGNDTFALASNFPPEFKAWFSSSTAPEKNIAETTLLAPGDSFKGNINIMIPAASIDGLRFTHPVRASSRFLAEATQSREVKVTAAAPLLRAVVKTAKTSPLPGENVSYRVALLNVGSVAASDIIFRLDYPPQLEPLESAAVSFKQESKGTLVLSGLNVNSGESKEFTIEFKLKADSLAGQELLTRGEVRNNRLETTAAFVSNPAIVQAQRGVVVRSASNRQVVIPGQTITVPYIVTNNGNIREKFKMTTEVTGASDAIVFYDINRDGIRQGSEPVITEVGPLAPREEANIVIEIKTPRSAVDASEGNARISFTSEGDPNQSFIGSTKLVYSRPVLKMAMSGKGGQLKPGDVTAFELTLTNHGTNLARVVELYSYWPEQLELVAADPTTSSSNNGTILWKFKELGAGEKRTIKVSFRLKPGAGVGTAIEVKNSLKYEDQLGNRY